MHTGGGGGERPVLLPPAPLEPCSASCLSTLPQIWACPHIPPPADAPPSGTLQWDPRLLAQRPFREDRQNLSCSEPFKQQPVVKELVLPEVTPRVSHREAQPTARPPLPPCSPLRPPKQLWGPCVQAHLFPTVKLNGAVQGNRRAPQGKPWVPENHSPPRTPCDHCLPKPGTLPVTRRPLQ